LGKKYKEIFFGLLFITLFWQGLSMVLQKSILPSPLEVVPLFFRLMNGELTLHFLASCARVSASIILSVLFAVPLGLILGQSRKLNKLVNPVIAVLYPIPKIVFLPIVYVLMGISDFSKIFLISLILFFQILVVVRDEAMNLPEDLLLSARSLGAGRLALYFFIYGPASIPGILTSIRISISTAIAVLFLAEQSLTEYGLGYFIIVKSYQILRYKEMYAGILAISMLGAFFYLLIGLLEGKLSKHRNKDKK
jgi:ABC-type nitrate/sulfonate/bicarbonate transport system permease component